MLENIITDDKKLDEVYRIVKRMESRERTRFWWRLIVRFLILALVIFVALNPIKSVGLLTDFMMPIMTDAVNQAIEQNKNSLLESADSVRDSVLQSVKKSLQPKDASY